MNIADYIITGAGASGLLLAYRLSKDSFFNTKSILIIDKTKNKGNDRTWCYWEETPGEWDDITHKTWSKIYFGSSTFSKTIDISPFTYKMIRSNAFYKNLWKTINLKPNIRFIQDTIDSFETVNDEVVLQGKKSVYKCSKLFNSIPDTKAYLNQNKYPVLQQHFLGWFIKTKTDCFDDSTAKFMDFNIPQNGNTRFMYMLPIDKKTALFEYTLFSKKMLEASEYEKAIRLYLQNKNITDYEIIETEKGAIPMTAFKFSKLNSKHILNIGTAGGWTKASTGYTFRNTVKHTQKLVDFLKSNNDFSKYQKKTKYWFYDLIFLDVLAHHNANGTQLFSSMFRKGKIKTIFNFLDEESTGFQDIKIILSVPSKHFISAFFKRLFQGW